ncbi:hypothetical protein ACW4TU_02745 [Streptomyces sp. QTS52]
MDAHDQPNARAGLRRGRRTADDEEDPTGRKSSAETPPAVVCLPVRDVEPIVVRLGRWRDDPRPAGPGVIELLTDLYRKV